ncbi:MAG: hypothetical protein ACREAM_17515 [Blastocatellia bacterium]
MNCQDFELIVINLARGRLLDATTREQSLTHTEVCAQCAARLAEERALMVGVQLVIEEITEEEAPARVEAALLAAFRQQVTASPAFIPTPGGTRNWSSWKLAAIAAGILLLISVVTVFWRSSNSPKPRHEERAILPKPASAPGPQVPPLTPPEPLVGRDQVAAQQPGKMRNRERRRAPGNRSDEAEAVTRFFSLREGEDLTALDSVRLVRVELQGSALREIGLPVAPETADAPVKADVVLGQDGLARAIRFVTARGAESK